MKRFLLNLWWFFYFLKKGLVIRMSLTPEQLQTLQNDMAALVAAASADTTAQAALATAQAGIAAAQTAVTTAQATATQTAAAVTAAGAQLEADAQADFPPAPPPAA